MDDEEEAPEERTYHSMGPYVKVATSLDTDKHGTCMPKAYVALRSGHDEWGDDLEVAVEEAQLEALTTNDAAHPENREFYNALKHLNSMAHTIEIDKENPVAKINQLGSLSSIKSEEYDEIMQNKYYKVIRDRMKTSEHPGLYRLAQEKHITIPSTQLKRGKQRIGYFMHKPPVERKNRRTIVKPLPTEIPINDYYQFFESEKPPEPPPPQPATPAPQNPAEPMEEEETFAERIGQKRPPSRSDFVPTAKYVRKKTTDEGKAVIPKHFSPEYDSRLPKEYEIPEETVDLIEQTKVGEIFNFLGDEHTSLVGVREECPDVGSWYEKYIKNETSERKKRELTRGMTEAVETAFKYLFDEGVGVKTKDGLKTQSTLMDEYGKLLGVNYMLGLGDEKTIFKAANEFVGWRPKPDKTTKQYKQFQDNEVMRMLKDRVPKEFFEALNMVNGDVNVAKIPRSNKKKEKATLRRK